VTAETTPRPDHAHKGADVLLSYLDEHEDAEETARWVRKTGRMCVLVPGDPAEPVHCRSVVDRGPSRSSAASTCWSATPRTM
jgi:hypothetical protein